LLSSVLPWTFYTLTSIPGSSIRRKVGRKKLQEEKEIKLTPKPVVSTRPRLFWFFELRKEGIGGKMVILGAAIVVAIVIMTALAPFIAPHSPTQLNVGPIMSPPSFQFPMGTNQLGQDLLSRIMYGSTIMLEVGILSVLLCLAIGVPIGLASGYISGIPDRVVSLVMDSIYAFPGLVLAIAIAAVLGRGVINLSLAIAVVYIPSYFRVTRSQVLSIKELPFIEAVKVSGGRARNVIFRQILPNVIPSIAVIASINVADAILTEAGLTYLGLGPNISRPDWGYDILNGKNLLLSGAWWAWLFPGIMIVVLAAGFALMGDGLSEVWNPKLNK
jgi:peptide/nickel transport system permease protein